jgi:iron complex outermembrane receptor protein/hemoglobin/transferrin/lactoferrin receptor protein
MRIQVARAATIGALVLAVLAGGRGAATATHHTVEGRLTDGSVGLPGAVVRLVELGRVAHTDENGAFRFTAVPAGRFTLGVHLPGFGSLHRDVEVPLEGPLQLRLDAGMRFAEEVSVTAAPWTQKPLETAQQTDVVDAAVSRRESVASVGEAVAGVPGVAFIPTGNALGTPVVRGVSEHRVRVLNDGLAVNHQQFSWRHSPNVEPAFAERLELVRGPASVLYGPEAMGGVINLVHAPLPFAPGGQSVFHGEVAPGFASNTGEWTGRARIEGAFSGFGWRVDALRREGGDIRTPEGTLDNTDFAQTNASVMAGQSGAWGSLRVRFHHWEDATGFYRPTGFRLDLDDDVFAADLHVPAKAGVFEVLLGRQQNRRRAFPAELGGQPGVDLDLVTFSARLGFEHRRLGRFRGQAAVEYQGLDNTLLAGQLVPEYRSHNLALMLYEEARFLHDAEAELDRVIVSLGLRWDDQSLDVAPFPEWQLPSRVSRNYGAATGALGLVVRLRKDLALAGSVGRGWRPPSPFEQYARGVHGGVAAFQLGNPDLIEESNRNAEVSVRYQGRRLKGSISAYRNAFDDYIYLADSGQTMGPLPVFVHAQADAIIRGLEAAVDLAPVDWLKLSLAYTLTDTRNERTGAPLPQTPPDRLLAGLRFERPTLRPFSLAYLGLFASLVAKGEVSGPDEPLGTPTDGYQVFDLRGGASLRAGRATVDLSLAVRNLFDTEYTDFLWSYKPFAPSPGRDVRLAACVRF